MRRLATVAVVLLVLIGGCSGSGPRTAGTDGTPTEPPKVEMIVYETLVTDARYPVDATPGSTWQFHVDVHKGGPVAVVISNANGKAFERRIDAEAEFSFKPNASGTHYIHVAGGDRIEVTITRSV